MFDCVGLNFSQRNSRLGTVLVCREPFLEYMPIPVALVSLVLYIGHQTP